MTIRAAWLALGLCALLAVPARAQRGSIESRAFEDTSGGYRLRTPKGWNVVPVAPDDRARGLAFRADAERSPKGGRFRVVVVATAEEFSKWTETCVAELARKQEELETFARDLQEEPLVDETLEVAGTPGIHRRWRAEQWLVDTWFAARSSLGVGVIGILDGDDKFVDSWLSTFERSFRSLELFAPSSIDPGKGATYAQKLEFVRAEASRTPGWRVLPTPSKKFILTTSCDNARFLDEVIDRLERSRMVFEEDYPPPPDFTHVSVVRVCASAEEFHHYGNTGGGVMGWFNPATVELVLFDAKDVDRNMSYAVMTHEAFHQYCHFLFGRSEAHRWFDEGHGDYYGGLKFSDNGKPKITARMPGGLERLSGIRELVQSETYAPLQEHLNFDHQHWQSQGPSNVSCYEQSWSIVYMLRQGMLGKVPSAVWRKEYAQILPHYIETLRKGFEEAYRAAREKRRKEAGMADDQTVAAIELDSSDLGEDVVHGIWTAAMKASFGQVDLVRFEEDWKLYVRKYLKD